jgi:hypothetical protein
MSILSNHFPEVLAELNADPNRPESPEPTPDEITAMGEAAGTLLRQSRPGRKARPRPQRFVRVLAPATPVNLSTFIEIDIHAGPPSNRSGTGLLLSPAISAAGSRSSRPLRSRPRSETSTTST